VVQPRKCRFEAIGNSDFNSPNVWELEPRHLAWWVLFKRDGTINTITGRGLRLEKAPCIEDRAFIGRPCPRVSPVVFLAHWWPVSAKQICHALNTPHPGKRTTENLTANQQLACWDLVLFNLSHLLPGNTSPAWGTAAPRPGPPADRSKPSAGTSASSRCISQSWQRERCPPKAAPPSAPGCVG